MSKKDKTNKITPLRQTATQGKNHAAGHPSLVESRSQKADGGSRKMKKSAIRNPQSAIVPTGARAAFLAANPKARKLQTAHLKEITTRIGKFRVHAKKCAKDFIDLANEARAIGFLVIDFLDTLPGKQLTLDFWTQMESLFVDQYGNQITQDMLKLFEKAARNHPEPFTAALDALQYRQPILLASGDESFQLSGERPQQTLHAPPNPLSLLKDCFNPAFEEIFTQLRGDKNYCPDGEHLRDDLRETLKVELPPRLAPFDNMRLWLRSELGI
jgi:hypothetical protein